MDWMPRYTLDFAASYRYSTIDGISVPTVLSVAETTRSS